MELYSLMEAEPITVYRSSQIFRQFLFNYREQLSASVIVAGFDSQKGGQIYALPLGGMVTRQHFTASGSGSTFVTGFLDNQWRPNMTLDQVRDVSCLRIFHEFFNLFPFLARSSSCFPCNFP